MAIPLHQGVLILIVAVGLVSGQLPLAYQIMRTYSDDNCTIPTGGVGITIVPTFSGNCLTSYPDCTAKNEFYIKTECVFDDPVSPENLPTRVARFYTHARMDCVSTQPMPYVSAVAAPPGVCFLDNDYVISSYRECTDNNEFIVDTYPTRSDCENGTNYVGLVYKNEGCTYIPKIDLNAKPTCAPAPPVAPVAVPVNPPATSEPQSSSQPIFSSPLASPIASDVPVTTSNTAKTSTARLSFLLSSAISISAIAFY